jgi:hypothetical protein
VEVPVDEPAGVRVVEDLGDPGEQREHHRQAELPLLCENDGQVRPLDQLARDPRPPVRQLAALEHARHPGVAQHLEDARLAHELRRVRGVAAKGGVHRRDPRPARQQRMGGAPGDEAVLRRDLPLDDVVSDPGTGPAPVRGSHRPKMVHPMRLSQALIWPLLCPGA